jgi:hypothetical protein
MERENPMQLQRRIEAMEKGGSQPAAPDTGGRSDK